MTKTLFVNGDSWAFGSEIMDPEFCVAEGTKGSGMGYRFKPGYDSSDKINDSYRIPRIWSTYLGKLLDCEQVTNWSYPARSNDTIYDSTISWILENYIIPKKSTKDLTVVIGWSSPERKNITIEDDDNKIRTFTLWPAMNDTQYYSSTAVKTFFKFYVTHMWVEQEYLKRFIEQNFSLQNFCKTYDINCYVFNSFYMPRSPLNPSDWENVKIQDCLASWTNLDTGWHDSYHSWNIEQGYLLSQWKLIDEERFIGKDVETFNSYIIKNVDKEIRMCNWHPSPESHEVWAKYLATKIK